MLLVALYFSLLLLQCNPASSLLSPNAPVLIMVDGLTEYLSGHCKDYCNERGIRIIEILSPYMCGFFQNKGRTVPDKFRPPEEGEELAWAELMNVPISGFEGNNHGIHAISESECGVSTAERLQTSLGLIGNGMSPQLRNKYIMNMRAKAKGIKVLEQALVKSTDELEKFLQKLWSEGDEKLCVLKPYRGVASEGVYLCKSLEEAKKAFKSTYGTKQFGGGDNDAVLVQEYADGPEYAVDTVARDGDIKVIALWKYRKFAANNAPFVYQCSELVPIDSEREREVCDYCVEMLKAQDLKWGPTHTEIKYTSDGPRLIEINGRWHAQHFVPITRACLGNDAIITTLDGYYDAEAFYDIPDRPQDFFSNGLILHLVSFVEGVISEVRHLDEIRDMESVHLVDMQFEAGDRITKTVDIRTDSGYVLLIHEDPEVITKDYARICELQKTMFVIEESDENLVEEKEQDFKLDEIEETEDEATDSDSEEGSREVVEEDSTGHNSSSDETKGVDHTENAVESELVLKSDYNSENLDTDIINVDVEKKSPVPSDESFPKLEDELIAPVESSPIEIQEDQKDAVTESATSAAYRTSSYDSGEVDTNPSIKTSRRKSRRLQHLTKASSVRHLDELSPAEQWKRQVLDAAQKSYYPKEVGSYQPLKNFNFKQMVMSYLRRFIILGLGAYIASIFTTLTLPRFKSAIIS